LVDCVKKGKLKEPFTVGDVNINCKGLLIKSPSFLSKHRINNPGKYKEYFDRKERGKYSIIILKLNKMNDELNNDKKIFLLKEYQEISNNLRTFSNNRISVLGFGITLIGIILTQSINAKIPLKYIYDIFLMLLLFTVIQIIISLSTTMYLFTFHLLRISNIFVQNNFWENWKNYSLKNPMKNGASPFLYITRFLNSFTFVYVLITNVYIYFTNYNNKIISNVIFIIFLLLIFIIFILNFRNIENKLDPKKVKNKLYDEWKKSIKETS